MRSLLGAILDKVSGPPPFVSRRWAGETGTGIFSRPGSRTEQLRATASSGTLFGVVDALCEKTAAVDWQLWASAKSGKDEDRKLITSHPAIDLWESPNEFMTQRLFIEIIQQYLDLTGEGPIVVVRRAGIPAELWPVRPDRLAPWPDPDKFLAGYIYTAPDGEKVPLDVEDVIRLLKPDPDNIYRGLGPVQALMRTLDGARYSEEWNRKFFLNDATPGGIIEVEEDLADHEYSRFRERWAEVHQGVNNAHRVAILENGMKWVDRKYSMKDMQFAELATIGDTKILTAFRMPKFGVGQIDDVNRATAEASEYTITASLIVPRLDRWADALNTRLLRMYKASAVGLEWDYADPIQPNQETENLTLTARANAVAALVPVGFDGNSAVKAFELPDTLVWTKPPDPVAPTPPGDNAGAAPVNHHGDDAWHSIVGTLVPRDAAVVAQDLADVQAEWRAQLDALERQWAGVHTDQLDELERQVTTAVDERNPAALATLVVTTAAATTLLAAAMTALGALAAATMVREAAEQSVLILPSVGEAGELATVAAVTTALLGSSLATSAGREAIRIYTIASRGAEIAAQVRALYADVPASTIGQLGAALTRAQNAARMATLAGAPAARYYASERLDENTCKPCKDIDGVELPTLEAATLAYGGGPYLFCQGTVRCRGTMVAVWESQASDTWDQLVSRWCGPKAWDPIEHPRDPHSGEFVENPISEAAAVFMRTVEHVGALAAAVDDLRGGRRSEASRVHLGGGASGAGVDLVTLDDGTKLIHKRPASWGEIKDEVDAEQLSSLVAARFDVPVAGVYRDESNATWSNYVPGRTIGEIDEYAQPGNGEIDRFLATDASKRMGFVHMLIGNNDANSGNLIVGDDGSVTGLDHAFAFGMLGYANGGGTPSPRDLGPPEERPVSHFISRSGGKVDSQFVNNPLSEADVEHARATLESLRPDFDKLDRGAWLDKSLEMLDQLDAYADGEVDIL